MEWIHTDNVPSLCNLWEGGQGSQVDLFRWRVSASPVNFRNCMFLPTYFGSCPQRRLSPLREFVSAGAGLHGSSWMQTAAFPLPFSFCLPMAWTPGPDSSGGKSLVQISKIPAVNHSYWSCPWMSQEASLGTDPGVGLPSAALRTFCHPSRTQRGVFLLPWDALPASHLLSLSGKGILLRILMWLKSIWLIPSPLFFKGIQRK